MTRVGFVKDTETVEDPSGQSTPNESWEAENAKMIYLALKPKDILGSIIQQ